MSAPDDLSRGWRIFTVVLYTVLGGMTAFLEVLLVPLYVGAVIFPITLLIAAICNFWFPRAVRTITGSTPLSILPLAMWILVLFGSSVPTAMGDVLLPGYGKGQYVGEALLLVGLSAGVAGIVVKWPKQRRRIPRPLPSPTK